jgi:DNA-binding CsgD family transcriptional regulator
MNDRAQEMLQLDCGITVGPFGRYRFLDASIQEAAEGIARSTSSGPIALFHSPNSTSPRFRYTLVRMSTQPITEYLGGPKLAIIIEQMSSRYLVQRLTALGTAHKLTTAEIEVARCVAEGASISTAADMRGVSRETIRSQLKSVYAKLSIAGKADLLRLMI